MNRFLYAEGDPATLVDPSGHCPESYLFNGDYAGCQWWNAQYMMAAGGHAVTTFAGNTVNLAGSVKDASLCVVNPWCWGNIAGRRSHCHRRGAGDRPGP